MKFSSDLLYRWVRAIGTGNSLPDSLDLEIPTALVPVVSVPGPLSRFAGFSNTDNQRESFVAAQTMSLAASQAAITARLGTLGRGLWEITLWAIFVASYTQAYTTDPEGLITLVDNIGTETRIQGFFAVLNVPQSYTQRFRILTPDDGWHLRGDLAATGVAQTQALTAAIIANRLQ